MTIRSILALTITSFLATSSACVTNGDDDDSSDDGGDMNDDDDDDDDGDADPSSGEWHYLEFMANRNDCNIDESYGNGGGDFALDNHGDGTFTVVPGDGTAPFLCSLDGADFSCPDRATEESEVEEFDALLVGQATAEGSFSSDERGAGSQTATITCTGNDCAIVETYLGVDFPCEIEVDFVIGYQGGI